jgi:enoyl-CoA hydratase
MRLGAMSSLRMASHQRRFSSSPYDLLLTEVRDKTALITLNRPKALNALNNDLVGELLCCLKQFEADEKVGCIVVTGSEKAFVAGADIKYMAPLDFVQSYKGNLWSDLNDVVVQIRKPIIAAVNGYALGGGCELAMLCDIIIAGDKAKFGQPEITLGTIPGCGGSQRLPRWVGKSKAMQMCLTGEMIGAEEAKQIGLVSEVVPADELVDTAVKMGNKISSFSQPVVSMLKQSINSSFETPLSHGIMHERHIFYSTFSTKDQKEGMAAFAEKRKAEFTNE